MKKNHFSLCDLGCGDGSFLFSLHNSLLLEKANYCVGVDLSPIRIEMITQLKKNGLNVNGIISDACFVPLPDSVFDFIICSQVIEHVKNDKELLNEAKRLLKKDGILYLSTVYKDTHGFWIYRSNGKWVLDPTHIREYRSKEEFVSLLESCGLNIIRLNITPCCYPVIDMIIKALVLIGLSADKARTIYFDHTYLKLFKKLKFRVPGYYIIETLCSPSFAASSDNDN